MTAKLGLDGQSLRTVIPPAAALLEREGYFFWAEYDRISGYRKVQMLGAWIRQIDCALEVLDKDRARLETLLQTALGKAASAAERGERSELSATNIGRKAAFMAVFDEAYQDFQAYRETLYALEHPTNRGEVTDLQNESDDVMALVASSADGRPAATAITLAVTFMRSEHIVDTENSFP